MNATNLSPWRFCVAPMMDWTDRHCRYFHRLLTRHARLYTEMVTTGALLHGDVPRHLDFSAQEHPVALQLGGSEPDDLAQCARLAEDWGYDEINLNCGCPSERVQRGAFGACLMAEPLLVRDSVKAMVDALRNPDAMPVTVKHRIGIDRTDSYAFVRDFVGTVSEGGARVFIVHARSAWLKGLSPKENREVPPLRYDYAAQLKQDFPGFTIVVNGGIASHSGVAAQLQAADGVMIGRQAYHDPWWMAETDARWFADESRAMNRMGVVDQMVDYAAGQVAQGVPLRGITRHMLGLYQGVPGARAWRRLLSDAGRLKANDPTLIREAAHLAEPLQMAA
jgi:tRNA-dihydrouridine synthase A